MTDGNWTLCRTRGEGALVLMPVPSRDRRDRQGNARYGSEHTEPLFPTLITLFRTHERLDMTQPTVHLRLSIMPIGLTARYSGFTNGVYDLTHEMPWDKELPAVGDVVSVGEKPWYYSAHSPLRVVARVWELDGTPTLLLQGLFLYEDPEKLKEPPFNDSDAGEKNQFVLMHKDDTHPMVDLLAAGWVISYGDQTRHK